MTAESSPGLPTFPNQLQFWVWENRAGTAKRARRVYLECIIIPELKTLRSRLLSFKIVRLIWNPFQQTSLLIIYKDFSKLGLCQPILDIFP